MSTASIGIFDSGVGGLTVVRAVQRMLPCEDIIYFADTARLPYGMKSAEQIISYSRQILHWMQHDHKVKLVIVACNTSSALALEAVSGEFAIPVIGTIAPVVHMMLKKMPGRRIAVIATPATAQSQAFENAFHLAGYNGMVQSIGCPQFVPLIEARQSNSEAALKVSKEYLASAAQNRIDTVIYGCTHYPWMEATLRKVLPQHILLIDPAEYMAQEAHHYLSIHGLLHISPTQGKVHYYTSGSTDHFGSQVAHLLGIDMPKVRQHLFHA